MNIINSRIRIEKVFFVIKGVNVTYRFVNPTERVLISKFILITPDVYHFSSINKVDRVMKFSPLV